MFNQLNYAITVIEITGAFCLVILMALFSLKTYRIWTGRKMAVYAEKFQDYFVYLSTHLGRDVRLKPPAGPLSSLEIRVIQKKLFVWIEALEGISKEQLIGLCRQLGFVEGELEGLSSLLPWRRMEAAHHLGLMGIPEAWPVLMGMLSKTRDQTDLFILGRAAARASKQLGELKAVAMGLGKHRKNGAPLLVEILREGPVHYQSLLYTFLQEQDPQLIQTALLGLLDRPAPDLVEPVQNLIVHGEREVRIKGARLWFQLGVSFSDEVIKALLHHDDWEIRALTAQFIGRWGFLQHRGLLRQSLQDPEWWVRYYSADSLAQLGEAGFALLCEIAKDGEGQVGSDLAWQVVQGEMTTPLATLGNWRQRFVQNAKRYQYQKYFSEPVGISKIEIFRDLAWEGVTKGL